MVHVGKVEIDSGFVTEGNNTENVSFVQRMYDGVDRVFYKIESTESIRLSGLTLSGLTVHGAGDVKDADDCNSITFGFEFWRGDLDVGHEIATIEGGECLESEILVVVHEIWVL